MRPLPAPLWALVEARVGPVGAVADRSWAHGVSRVWRVEAGGAPVWVKQHTQPRKYRQEARAYREVVPALARAGVTVPSALVLDDALCALVLTEVRGEPADEADPAVHRGAGAAVRVLHALPYVDDDPLPLAEAVRARFERWAEEAEGIVTPSVVAAVGERLDPAAFAGATRCWCHRDWSPRNWLVVDGRVGMLDFEHCLPDLWLLDLVKLADGIWRRHPGTRAAFLAGYGVAALTAREADQLERLLWLHALGTTVWGAAHGDPAYEAHGRRLLSELA
ncbi:MAG: aminoglycoside phosphotransferase family protein [Myxococcota bacterium]